MAYIGKEPQDAYNSPTKDRFSGDASTTAFTLSRSVANAADLEVFVDNVQLTKLVTKSNSSPVVSVFTILNAARPMTFSLTRRSYSADEFVESYELKANFAFSKR